MDMTGLSVELKMLAWTAGVTILMWLPYIGVTLLRHGPINALQYRNEPLEMAPWAKRAKRAHYNAIENLAPFAALVITAHLAGVSNGATETAAVAYFWFRIAHYGFYISNIPFTRTLTFTGGWLAVLCILYQIVIA